MPAPIRPPVPKIPPVVPGPILDPAEETLRPIASNLTRIVAFGGAGAAAGLGVAFWADNKYRDVAPHADGTSEGFIDRYEGRKLFAGHNSMVQYPEFIALLALGPIYTRLRGDKVLTAKEFSMLRSSYALLGGALIASSAATLLMKPLTPFVQTELPDPSKTTDGPIRK